MRIVFGLMVWAVSGCGWAGAATLQDLPVLPEQESEAPTDWLVDHTPRPAGVYRSTDGKELLLSNGLVRRVFRLAPNAATVAFDNLMRNESLLRAV